MKADEIARRVQRSFGDDNESQIMLADIIDWINAAGREIAKKTEILQGIALLDTAVGSNDIVLPVDFLRDMRLEFNGVKIERTTLDQLDLFTDNDPTKSIGTQPLAYYIWGDKLHFYPYTNTLGVGVVKLFYVRYPTAISAMADTPEVPEVMHEDIVTYCMMRARELNEDYQEASRLQSDWTGRLAEDREIADNPNANSYPAVRNWDGDFGW